MSEDLTVVFLRGNGSPRTFRLSLPALQRSLTAVGFLFAFALVATVFLLLLNLFHGALDRGEALAPAPSSPVEATGPTSAGASGAPDGKKGFWQRITNSSPPTSAIPANEEEELKKEMGGLREDIAKLNAQLDGRQTLNSGQNQGLLQFFGPRNVAVPEESSPMRVKNVKVVHSPAERQVYVDFELHNVDPEQKQARGYIVVLAKTSSSLTAYPPNLFSPSDNIVLDYTKGETFAVSRFRQARAAFASAPLEGKKPRFQVLLFTSDGRVIADLHAEDSR